MDTVKCEQCGSNIPRSTRFCPECGHSNPAASDTSRSEVASSGYSTPEVPSTPPYAGAPTVNISNTQAPLSSSQAQTTRYTPNAQPSYPPPPPSAPGYAPTQNFSQAPTVYPGAQPPTQAFSNYSQNPLGYQYQSQIGVAGVTPRDSTVALLLELIGYLGFLGIGHIYAGRTNRGIGLLIGWILYNILLVTLILPAVALGSVFTCGLGCLLFIPIILFYLGAPVGSGLWIKNELDKERAYAGPRY
jgi:hypothetical protein